RRRHTRSDRDWSSDVCSSDLFITVEKTKVNCRSIQSGCEIFIAGSALGLVWSFLQPLWMLLLFTFVFSTVMKISLAGARTGHFAVFLFSGLLPWMSVQEGVSRASSAVPDNSSLVKKLRFRAGILVVAVVLAA